MFRINISNFVFRSSFKDNIAIQYYERRISYNDLDIYSTYIASYIINRYGKGKEPIGLFIDGSINFSVGLFSILKSGKVAVPINTASKSDEIIRLIEYLGIRVFVSDDTAHDKLCKLSDNITEIISLYEQGKYKIISLNKIKNREYDDNELEDTAVILHTSGSLSCPKSVMLTHNNIYVSSDAIADDLSVTEKDRSLIVLPMYYSSALIGQFFAHMIRGASVCFTKSILSPKAIFMNIEKYGITDLSIVPGMMNEIESMLDKLTKFDVSSLRYICVSGGSVSGKRANHIANAYPKVNIIRTYGLTETATRVSHFRQPLNTVTDTCAGFPLSDYKIAIKKAYEGDPYGDIWVKGNNVMKGYYKRKDETSRIIIDDWLNTGDVGYIDEQDQLHVIGRKKNVIIRNGENIYPEEIEEVISSFPSVKEAYVYGIDDGILGQVPVAEITVFEHFKFNRDELINYCYQKMSRSKVPIKYTIVNEIEKTSNGKIKRRKDINKWNKN